MNMKPVQNKVILSRIDPVLTTESGIILKNPIDVDKALIEAIGPDVKYVSVGDNVMVDWSKTARIDDNLFVTVEDEIVFIFDKD